MLGFGGYQPRSKFKETLKEIRQKAESDPLASAGLCTNTCRFAQQHTYVYTHARTHEDGLIILKNWKKIK